MDCLPEKCFNMKEEKNEEYKSKKTNYKNSGIIISRHNGSYGLERGNNGINSSGDTGSVHSDPWGGQFRQYSG